MHSTSLTRENLRLNEVMQSADDELFTSVTPGAETELPGYSGIEPLVPMDLAEHLSSKKKKQVQHR